MVAPAAQGVSLEFGNTEKGGTAKNPLVTLLPRTSIKVVKGFNPRSGVSGLEELTESIKKDGILSSLVVRPGAKAGTFELVCGERRFRAAEALGLEMIPVQVRSDLVGADDDAKALAVAENSDDARTGLNPIELGTAFQALAKAGWSVATIASTCGIHAQKVRRCLAIMEAPADVQKSVVEGKLSANTAIAVAKLDPKTREALKEQLRGDLSAVEVRRLAQTAAKKDKEGEVSDGKPANRKEGVKRDASLIVWRQARIKQAQLQELCYAYVNVAEEKKEDSDYFECRGAIGVLLWDRGDLSDTPLLPAVGDDTPASQKLLKRIEAIIIREAEKHKVPAAAGKGEEAAAEEGGKDD
jgi:ParB family chromosome partitioning protein